MVILGRLLHQADVLAGQFFCEVIQESCHSRIRGGASCGIVIGVHRRGCCPAAHGGHWHASYRFRGFPGRYPVRLRIRRASGFPFELGYSRAVTVRVA